MSNKNKLQELLQKRGLKLPEYKTIRNKPPNDNMFISTVSISGRTFTGTPASTKKNAEQNTARIALRHMKHKTVKLEKKTPLATLEKTNKIYLIDLENIHLKEKDYKFFEGTYTLGFLSMFHQNADKDYPFQIFKIKSSAREAADHAMSFRAGYITHRLGLESSRIDVIIFSRDRSADNLRVLMTDYFRSVKLLTKVPIIN